VGWGLGANRLNRRAWIWTDSGAIKDINGLIRTKSGWTLEEASGINAGGMIVGQGQLTSGAQHGFLLTPLTAPATAVMTAEARLTEANASRPAPLAPLVGDDLVRWLADSIHGKKIRAARHP
jgi:hypothetical protein